MAEVEEFDTWLYDRLRDLQTDENIFGPYIKSIVEGDEDTEEKIEALDGLLIELQADSNVEKFRNEILDRWNTASSATTPKSLFPNTLSAAQSLNPKGGEGDSGTLLEKVNPSSGQLKSDSSNGEVSESLGSQMDAFLRLSGLDSQSNSSSEARAPSSSSSARRPQGDLGADSALRAAILSQYCANESSSEDENDGLTKPKQNKVGQPLLDGLDKNDNAEKVMAEQRETKEKSRAEHAKKKDRDKEDRAKQKQAAQDRKDKAKKKATKGERKR